MSAAAAAADLIDAHENLVKLTDARKAARDRGDGGGAEVLGPDIEWAFEDYCTARERLEAERATA